MTRKYNNDLSRGVGLFFLVAGVVMAFLVVNALNSLPDKPDKPDKPEEAKQPQASRKDTLYVQLTNGGIPGTPAPNQNGAANPRKEDTPNASPQASPPISHEGYRQLPLKPKLTSDSLRRSFSAYRGDRTSGYLAYLLISCGVLIILLGGIVYLHRIPIISRNIKKDRDPAILDKVFKDCGPKINEMCNPRRIKRFSNKVRFHYYYLSNGQNMSQNDLSDVVKILLYLEANHSVMDLDRSDGNAGGKDAAWFFQEVVKKVLAANSRRQPDDPLMAKVFELNKNIIA
jgi:hypothetical protein